MTSDDFNNREPIVSDADHLLIQSEAEDAVITARPSVVSDCPSPDIWALLEQAAAMDPPGEVFKPGWSESDPRRTALWLWAKRNALPRLWYKDGRRDGVAGLRMWLYGRWTADGSFEALPSKSDAGGGG